MEKTNGEKINLDIYFEKEINLQDEYVEKGISLENVVCEGEEYEFEDTLEIDINEVRENV